MRGSWQRLWSAALAVCFVAGAVAAEAQELRDRDRTLEASRRIADDIRRARLHYGPFYLLSSIQLADIGYDQSFYLPTADSTSGFRFGISAPQRLYITPNRKTYFSVDVSPEWSRFGGIKAHDQFGYKSRAEAQFLLNHLYLDVYGIRNDSLHADVGEIGSILTRKLDEVGATGELKYSSRTSLTYSAATRGYRFPVGEADKIQPNLPVSLLDRTEHAYRGALVHKTFPLTSLLIAAEYAGYSFPQATYKDSHRKYAGAGFNYESGRTAVRLEAGMANLDFQRPNEKDFRGGVGNFGIDRRMSDRWSVNGSLSRDLSFSLFAANNYYVASRATARTDYALTRHLSVNAGYAILHDDYDIPTPGSKRGGLFRRHDRATFPSIGWIYSSSRFFRGGFDIGYLSRTSNFPINEADGIRLVLHLSLTL